MPYGPDGGAVTRVPGPMGSTPAPGNPPTPSQPAQPQAPQAPPSEQNLLDSLLGSQLGGIASTTNLQNQGLLQQQAIGGAQQGITDQNLLQNYQNTLASLGLSGQQLGIQGQQLGLQGTQIGQQQAYEQGQYGLTQQEQALQKQEAQQNYAQNLQGLQSSGVASGTFNTGTEARGQQQLSQGLQNTLAQLGIQGGQSALTNTYQQQQIQDALKQLGFSQEQLGISKQQLGLEGTQAGQQYQTGTQEAANTYANLTNQIGLGEQANTAGEYSQVGQLLGALLQSGMFTQ